MFGYSIIKKEKLRRMTRDLERANLIFIWASNERTNADKLLSRIMLVSDSAEVSQIAQEISEIIRGERRKALEF